MNGMELRPRVAITMGDAAGIGPEIIVKALADASVAARAIPLVLGEARVLERAMDATQVRLPIRTIAKPAEAEGRAGTIELIDYRNVDVIGHRWGEVNPAFGEAAVHYTREAGRLALAGEIDAMVSAPLNKEAMHAAGHRYEGQTEILGELTGTKPAMLLLLGTMRLMLCTNHMALRAVCDYVRKDRVLDRLVLAAAALRGLGIARPALAVPGLNPHACEAGAFRHAERDEVVPAVPDALLRGSDGARPARAATPRLASATRTPSSSRRAAWRCATRSRTTWWPSTSPGGSWRAPSAIGRRRKRSCTRRSTPRARRRARWRTSTRRTRSPSVSGASRSRS